MGAERIRAAIARFKAKGVPVAVSMGNLAASGGYWVSTPADRIFAEPATITGSIGIFAVIPSFEDALAKIGVGTDGVRTTPLSGQPDPVGGINPTTAAVIQGEIDMGYRRFVGLVAASRHMTPQAVDRIAQGRVWDGGTARQLGLVDEFGDLDQALVWAAHRAKLAKWHPVWLGDRADSLGGMVQQFLSDDSESEGGADDARMTGRDLAGRVAMARFALAGQMAGDLDRLLGGQGAQAYCLECAGLSTPLGAPANGVEALARGHAGWLPLLFGLTR